MNPSAFLSFAAALAAASGSPMQNEAPAALPSAGRTLSYVAAAPSAAVGLRAGHGPRRATRRSPALSRVRAANRAATREPRGDRFVNAVQVYPWLEGALYRLYTAPEQVSDIALQPGEALVSVAAGDTVRWVIGDTTSGGGAARRVHILVKPVSAGLATNLVVTTDRRVYHVELESHAGPAMASISWTYAEDSLIALRRAEAAAEAAPVADRLAVERLDFNYKIVGDDPPWRPIRAFDDGRQVFIEFPPGLEAGEAPPLFVKGEAGSELVNYRQRGRYYVLDRLFASAELRLGNSKQQVVRIVKGEGGRERRRGRRP